MADSPPPKPEPQQQQQSVRSSRVQLPRYTSIDLENELPEIYNTSLNPNLHDPDMTMFFNRNLPPFHSNWSKRHSPPPMYQSRSKSGSNSSIQSSTPSTKNKKIFSRNCLAGGFLCVFIVTPILILLVFYIIPRIVVVDNQPFQINQF
ncbi:unnamed protein product [Caenorhabditis angaria]|uniref:Uncharacterized protein n=1 Tax=Caenorhabditis angaria TaxID=860376 RepID=A0A9P1N5R1_9PELO|nr:unnamed protein product [Caenorhabditis angaria]